ATTATATAGGRWRPAPVPVFVAAEAAEAATAVASELPPSPIAAVEGSAHAPAEVPEPHRQRPVAESVAAALAEGGVAGREQALQQPHERSPQQRCEAEHHSGGSRRATEVAEVTVAAHPAVLGPASNRAQDSGNGGSAGTCSEENTADHSVSSAELLRNHA
ncbi:unnamed protein product, partial [Phaeothamnion confervicola]